jgi:IS30 family transposase
MPKQQTRNPKQLLRQEQAFMLNLQGLSMREVSAKMGISLATIHADIQHEGERRKAENAARRKYDTARAIATYELIMRKAYDKSDLCDQLLREMIDGKLKVGSVGDNSLSVIIKARSRIDKLLGLEVPGKTDDWMEVVIRALDEGDGSGVEPLV